MYRISGEFLYSSFYAFYVSKELPHLLGKIHIVVLTIKDITVFSDVVTDSWGHGFQKNLLHTGEVNKMMFHYAESGNYQMFRANVVKSAQKFGKLAAKQRNKGRKNHQ